MFTKMMLTFLVLFTAFQAHAVNPTLIFKNQFGEQTNATIIGGTFNGVAVASHTIMSNISGSSAGPIGNTYSAVSAVLLPTMLLTGFTAGAGTVLATDTVIQGLQKLAGNVAAHQINSTASDVAGLVVDFNALLAKLQAAHLMQ